MYRRDFIKFIFASSLFLSTRRNIANSAEKYSSRLYTPTMITKLFGLYFIIDCWHHRVIYTDNINNKISSWKVLDEKIFGPHSITSDGNLFLVDNTGNNSLRIYKKIGKDNFEIIQNINGLGIRPHRVHYDQKQNVFFLLSSNDQTFFVLKEKNGILEIIYQRKIKEINNVYSRSFTINNDKIYFVTDNSIVVATYKDFNFSILSSIPIYGNSTFDSISKNGALNGNYRGSNDLFFLDSGKIILTCSSLLFEFNKFIPKQYNKAYIANSIEDFANKNNIKDISNFFIGMPYYVSKFDNHIWIPENTNRSRICKYKLINGDIDFSTQEVVFDFHDPTNVDLERKNIYPT